MLFKLLIKHLTLIAAVPFLLLGFSQLFPFLADVMNGNPIGDGWLIEILFYFGFGIVLLALYRIIDLLEDLKN